MQALRVSFKNSSLSEKSQESSLSVYATFKNYFDFKECNETQYLYLRGFVSTRVFLTFERSP